MNQPVFPDCCITFFENFCDAVLLTDDAGRIHLANPTACALFKSTSEMLMQQSFQDLFATEEVSEPADFVAWSQAAGTRKTMRFSTSDGTEFDCEWTMSRLTDESGATWVLLILRDVSPLQNELRRLHEAEALATELATHDFLTGLLNRRGFEEFMNHELDRARRSGKSSGLIMMDLDHFKQINDRFGHTGGDWLLREFAALMLNWIREYDVLGRFAGDEFILLLPETSQGESHRIAERLRLIIEAYPLKYHGEHLAITVSLGVISVPLNFEGTADALISLVDKALYKAKENRNCVYFQEMDGVE